MDFTEILANYSMNLSILTLNKARGVIATQIIYQ